MLYRSAASHVYVMAPTFKVCTAARGNNWEPTKTCSSSTMNWTNDEQNDYPTDPY